ncbi:hypothetical protein BS17DRAFT_789566, partial [Gyrodon lividus]
KFWDVTVSQLKPATLNTIPNQVQPPPPPVKVNGEPEYEISEILDSKIDRRHRNCQLLYLVKWAVCWTTWSFWFPEENKE